MFIDEVLFEEAAAAPRGRVVVCSEDGLVVEGGGEFRGGGIPNLTASLPKLID